MATWANLGLQNSSSPLIEQLNFFHDHTVLILIIITVIITYVIGILFLIDLQIDIYYMDKLLKLFEQFFLQLF